MFAVVHQTTQLLVYIMDGSGSNDTPRCTDCSRVWYPAYVGQFNMPVSDNSHKTL